MSDATECGLCANYPCTCEEPVYRRTYVIRRPSVVRVGEVTVEVYPDGEATLVIESPRSHVSQIEPI